MAEEKYLLKREGLVVDGLLDKIPPVGDAAGVYKSSLAFSIITNGAAVTQEQINEIAAISDAWKVGRVVYTAELNSDLGVLNIRLADDGTKCTFVKINQDGILSVYECNPSAGTSGKWSVYHVGADLFALSKHTHNATDVQEDTNHKFMTQTEKNTLSSLGTKAAQISYQSLGQNGCRKYEDGFLIQWGISSTYTSVRNVVFPLSFVDTDYSVVLNIFVDSENNNAMTSTFVKTKYKSSFDGYARYAEGLYVGWKFFWIAVGRWKK